MLAFNLPTKNIKRQKQKDKHSNISLQVLIKKKPTEHCCKVSFLVV